MFHHTPAALPAGSHFIYLRIMTCLVCIYFANHGSISMIVTSDRRSTNHMACYASRSFSSGYYTRNVISLTTSSKTAFTLYSFCPLSTSSVCLIGTGALALSLGNPHFIYSTITSLYFFVFSLFLVTTWIQLGVESALRTGVLDRFAPSTYILGLGLAMGFAEPPMALRCASMYCP
jgi:hypothetical protein